MDELIKTIRFNEMLKNSVGVGQRALASASFVMMAKSGCCVTIRLLLYDRSVLIVIRIDDLFT